MNNNEQAGSPLNRQPKKGRWLRWCLWSGLSLLALAILGYNLATSSFFLVHFILPKLSDTAGASVTVSGAEVHPFSQLTLKDLSIQASNQTPALTAKEVRLQYSLMDIIRGNIHVAEVSIVGANLQIVQDAKGANNLDPIFKAFNGKGSVQTPKATASAGKPLQLDIRKITLSDCTLALIQNHTNGLRDSTEIKNLNLTVTNVKNAETATLTLNAQAATVQTVDPQIQNRLETTLKADLSIALGQDLMPANTQGALSCSIDKTAGAFAQFNNLRAELQYTATTTEAQASLRFKRDQTQLGEFSVNGSRNPTARTDKITIRVQNIDKEILNVAGAMAHLDFGSTLINTTNEISITEAGPQIGVVGHLAINQLQVTKDNQTTPTLDVAADYDVMADAGNKTAQIKLFHLAATRKQAPLLIATLDQPTSIAWGAAAVPFNRAQLNCKITDLDLADWKAMANNLNPAGTINADVKIGYDQNQLIAYSLQCAATGMTATLGTNSLPRTDLALAIDGQITNFTTVAIEKAKIEVALNQHPAVGVTASGSYGLADHHASIDIQTESDLAILMETFPVSGLQLQSGKLKAALGIGLSPALQSVKGTLTLAGLTGQAGQTKITDLGTRVELDLENAGPQAKINALAGTITENAQAGGSFNITGTCQTTEKAVDLHVILANLNQSLLGPFLQPLLSDKQLLTVGANADLALKLKAGKSDLAGALEITNLVVKSDQKTLPPLQVAFRLDASVEAGAADLRELQIALAPNERAKNQIKMQGQVNFSQATNIQGNIDVTGDSLDLTTYYDLLAGNKQPGRTNTVTNPVAPQPPTVLTTTPLHNFHFKSAIGAIYLHEISITNFLMDLTINGGQIHLNPLQLTLNGGPIKTAADLDLAVPGYQYTLAASADNVPLAPLANSFMANANNKYNGNIHADVQISGQGTTGTDFKNHLAGHANFALTNANIQLLATNTKVLFIPINIPLIATLLNLPEITKSPVTDVSTRINLGQGQVDIQQAQVTSPAFLADC